jgi:hypothetical protein
MENKLLLQTKSPCKACGNIAVIVRSRKGGYVTQNCLKCKHHANVTVSELPMLLCGNCNEEMEAKVIQKNYWYECEDCQLSCKLADLVPHWDEFFEYDPHPLPSDYLRYVPQYFLSPINS